MKRHLLSTFCLTLLLTGQGFADEPASRLVDPGSMARDDPDAVRVMVGRSASSIEIPTNRALILEADTRFARVSIANSDIAEVSMQSGSQIYVMGKTPGRTTLTLQDAEGEVISNMNIHVSLDASELKQRLSQVLPAEPIEVRTANDGLILSGTVSGIDVIERAMGLAGQYVPGEISNFMTVGGTHQVMLHVRFAEIQRSVRRTLGASLGASISGSSGELGIGGGSGAAGGGGSFNLGFVTGGVQLAALIEALEARDMARTLAEPNLVALSGTTASFLAGGEFPVAVSDGEGGVAIEFKPFGVELEFSPTVMNKDLINLSLTAAVSGIDSARSATFQQGIDISAFSRRETTTTVEMRSGESFAIAGLLQDDFRAVADETPWMADLPIIGEMFRNTNYVREQTELVIIVTPVLAYPRRIEELELPTTQIEPGQGGNALLTRMGDRNNRDSRASEILGQGLGGAHGYIID